MANAATPQAGTQAPGGAHEAVFPPFDTEHFASQVIWLALVFGVLYLLMSRVALPRVAGIFEAREGKISGDLAAAETARKEAEDARIAHEKTLAEAKASSQALAQETHVKLAAQSEQRKAALTADLDAKLAAAEKQIAEMRTRAMANVDQIAGEAAGAIVQQLSGKAADPHAVARALAASKSA